jgi:hypothetical protein
MGSSTHKGSCLLFYGDFFLFHYLKISLYIALDNVNFITQQGAQFPKITNSLEGGSESEYQFHDNVQHTLDIYLQVSTLDHM